VIFEYVVVVVVVVGIVVSFEYDRDTIPSTRHTGRGGLRGAFGEYARLSRMVERQTSLQSMVVRYRYRERDTNGDNGVMMTAMRFY